MCIRDRQKGERIHFDAHDAGKLDALNSQHKGKSAAIRSKIKNASGSGQIEERKVPAVHVAGDATPRPILVAAAMIDQNVETVLAIGHESGSAIE